ncbi:MAG: type II secretion system inner membrane protein GspF [Candidatus Omnitrophica bacterium]|nr:type II secretion system inner membrane protein GspF [Candidatus Omnitrophota bacterium]
MPRFVYKAKRGPQEVIEGKIEAENHKQAAQKLNEMGLYLLSIDEETAAFIKKSGRNIFFRKGIALRDLSNFTRQLSNLLDAGLTMIRALNVLIEQCENPNLKHIIQLLRDDVRDGVTLQAALAKHPDIFSNLYVNMVSSGEISGTMEDVLRRLADFLERDEETVSKIRSSLTYPALMAFVGFITIFVLLSFVAPRLTAIFLDIGQALPLPTKILIALSSFFARFWLLILFAIGIAAIAFNRWIKSKEGKTAFDAFILKAPIIGPFVQKAEIARFGRTLGTLVNNGVPIVQALGVASKTMDNDIIRRQLEEARQDVVEGAPLSKSIKERKYFPAMMINMIAVGEESGALERALFKVADTYDTEIDRTVKTITALLEPTLILCMGLIVGFIVIAMLLPVFQLNLMVK